MWNKLPIQRQIKTAQLWEVSLLDFDNRVRDSLRALKLLDPALRPVARSVLQRKPGFS